MRRRHKNEQQERVISYWTLSLVDEHFMCSNSSSTSREKCLCLLLCRIFGTHFSYFMCCASGRNSFHWNHKILQLDVLCCMCCLSTHGYMQAQIMFSLRLNLILLQFFMAGAEGKYWIWKNTFSFRIIFYTGRQNSELRRIRTAKIHFLI